jgi:multiple sugar transport system permease protein
MTTARSDEVARLLPRPLRAVVPVLLLLLVLGPALYMIFASISPDLSVAAGHFLPRTFEFADHVHIWSTVDLGEGLVNSLVVAGTVAVLCAFVSLLAASVVALYPIFQRYLMSGLNSGGVK